MKTQKVRTIYTISLVLMDLVLLIAAMVLAYRLRVAIPWPEELVNQYSLTEYGGLLAIQVVSVLATLFFFRLYYITRSPSRIDQLYKVVAGVTIGTLMAIAVANLTLRRNTAIVDLPRVMVLYDWLLSIALLTAGRFLHQAVRLRLRDRGIGKDRLLLVGTGDTARTVLQRILWSPELGYAVVGVVGENGQAEGLLDIPMLGQPEDLPTLIEQHNVDEVIVAMPESGHRETVRVISYCERGRVTIKVVPDVFEFVTSQATIDELGGLPLLSVRDYALRGYLLIFKRVMDLVGAVVGLVFLSPLMLLAAVAIKLESPGPVFFVQKRMGLDGRPFMMIKFRSMRDDAERDGPGWTTDDDPRQTRFGRLLRRLEIDELPNLVNVLLGEMSLVGPRPEQAHYVSQFRQSVPRYMERHRDKGGMTGWAQVNGLRGDTSISERTRFDLWYSENWSILLDTKILLRTFWQLIRRRNLARRDDASQTPSPTLTDERA